MEKKVEEKGVWLDKRLLKIKRLLDFELEQDEFFTSEEKEDFEYVEVARVAHFHIDEDRLGVTFYSDVHPCTVAWYIRILQKHKVPDDYVVFETMYPKLNEKEEYVDMLFGDEADEEYKQSIFREEYKKLYLAHNAITFGPKQ